VLSVRTATWIFSSVVAAIAVNVIAVKTVLQRCEFSGNVRRNFAIKRRFVASYYMRGVKVATARAKKE